MKKGKIVKKVLAMLLCSALLVGILPVISPGIQVNADEEKLIDATCISWPGLEVWGAKENITSTNSQGCFTQSETPEIVLDFGKTAVINKIVTNPIMASADYYAEDYSFSVSINGTTWTEVYSTTGDNNDQLQRVYTFDAVQARYVKMSVTKCHGVYTDAVTFGLNGFFAYGFPKCEGTISSWTGLEMWGTSKANITNDILGDGGWCFADQPNTQPVLDLGENKAIKYIVTWVPDATNNYYPKGYTFDVSTDNETWTTVYTVADETNTSTMRLYEITKTDARYIRLTTTTAANGNAGANFGLSGFFAYGFDAPNPTITQLEVSSITWPGNEVWGAKANVIASDNEACFTQSATPEIVLDLGKTTIVNKIVTKPIEASAEYYADDYAFLVSTNGTTWTEVYSVTGDTNNKAERVYAFDAVQARYVKMSVTKCHGKYTDEVTFGLRGMYVYGTTKLDVSGISWTGNAIWGTNVNVIPNETFGDGGWAFAENANAQPILDLGKLCDIDYIVTWPCEANNTYYPSGYTFEVSEDGTTWTNVVTVSGEANSATNRIYPIVKTTGRYIRMTTTTVPTANFALSGFFAYGTAQEEPPTPPPVAPTPVPTITQLEAAGITWPGLEVWGAKENVIANDNNACFTQSETPEIVIDLGKTAMVNKIVTKPESAAADYYADDYAFLVSVDGTTWTEVYSITGDTNDKAERVYTFDAVQARYVKMSVTKCHGKYADEVTFGLRGFYAYGTAKIDGSISSWTGTEGYWGTTPTLVTNDTHGDGGTAFSEQANTQPVLDLGKLFNIDYIVAWPYNATNQYFPHGYDFEISSDGETWTKVYSVEDEDNTATTRIYPIEKTVGRYIRLTTTKNADGAYGCYFGLSGFFAYGYEAPNPTISLLDVSAITWPGTEVWGAKENVIANDNNACFTQSETPEIVIDLGKTAMVNKIVTKPESAAADYYADDYAFLVSVDGTNWTEVYSITGDTNDKAERVYTFDAVQARYVKMSVTKCHGKYADEVTFGLRGFYAYGTTKLDASGISWTAAPNFWSTNVNSIINDTRGDGGWAFADQANAQPILDLGAVCDVDYIVTWVINGNNQYYPFGYTFEVSKDGTTWTNVVTVENETNTLETRIYPIVKSEARYIRMTTTTPATGVSGGNFGLTGFYAYGTAQSTEPVEPPTPPTPPTPVEYEKIDLSDKTLSSNHSYENWGITIGNLKDGDFSATSRYIGATEAELGGDLSAIYPVWIQADLGSTFTVNKFIFYSREADSDNGLPKDFTIEVSSDGETWTTVVTKTDYTHAAGITNTFYFDEVVCQYIRLNVSSICAASNDGINAIGLVEIEVYGEAYVEPVEYDPIDLSGAGVTSNHSLENWGITIANLTDGDLSATSRYVGATEAELSGDLNAIYPVWIQVDLLETYKVNEFSFYNREDNCDNGLPKDFTIEVSTNGTDWTTVVTKTNYTHAETIKNTFTFDEVEIRYIRLNVTAICGPSNDGINAIGLVEIEVCGQKVTTEEFHLPENEISIYGKITGVSHQYERNTAKHLNDSDTSTSIIIKENNGKRATGMIPVWIKMDLKGSKTISGIRLSAYNTSTHGGFPTDFDIQVSNNGTSWSTVKTVTEVPNPEDVVLGVYTFNFDATTAKYVRIYVRNVGGVGDKNIGYTVHLREFEVLNGETAYDYSSYVKNITTWKAGEGINYCWASGYSQDVISASTSYEMWGWGVAALIDGSTDGLSTFATADSSISKPVSRLEDYVTVDLKNAYDITQMAFARVDTSSMKGVPTEFVLYGSLDGQEWYTLITRDTVKAASAHDEWFVFDVKDVKAVRYLRLEIKGVETEYSDELGLCAALAELKFYGTKNSSAMDAIYGEKIDLTKATLRATHSYGLWGHGIGNLYDEDKASTLFIATSEDDANYWARYKDEKTFKNETNEYIIIRLDGVYTVGRMKFESWWEAAGLGVPKAFTLEGSLDGESWYTIYDNKTTTVSETSWYNFRFTNANARYLRLRFHSVIEACDLGWVAALRELQFYGYLVEKDPSAADVQLPPAPSEDEFKNPYEKKTQPEESKQDSEPESQQESEQESQEEPETENWFAKIWKAIADFFASLFGGKKN